jgi:hypothetical protein
MQIKTFNINFLEQSLDRKLKDMEFSLPSQYTLSLQKQLQLLAILVSILTLVTTIIGIIGVNRLYKFFQNLFILLFN